jgi:D-serine deaminase-like pyridoxal phosphate-dependent protein
MPFPAEFLAKLATPCLIVDREAADRNIARVAEFFAKRRAKLRPHFKAHKCTSLLRRQIDAGGCSGVTCATPYEAELLASKGFKEILVANQIIDRAGLAALGRAGKHTRVTVAVDARTHVHALEKTAATNSIKFGVLIEIDVGMGRCGVVRGSKLLLDIAAEIKAAPHLELLGLQGYEGHVVQREDRALRTTMAWQCSEVLRLERERLEKAGHECQIVSGGGTGTYDISSEFGVLNEIQAGSYALMDVRYGSIDLPFENALFCATTVISRRGPDAGVLNAGLKSLSVEYGMPRPVTPGLGVISLSDEHARLTVKPDVKLAIGDTVLLIPAHIDPAINLHDAMIVSTGGSNHEIWPIDGRRKSDTLLVKQ